MNESAENNPLVDRFIDNLSQLYPNLFWPRYLFHHTDILNVFQILKMGKLHSRNFLKKSDLLKHDCAGQCIIGVTKNIYLDSVRLYFRPNTPPFFHIEGFRSKSNINSTFNAHCPIPIYLVFYSKKVLSIPGVKFSDGNLSSYNTTVFNDPNDLNKLNFEYVYHRSSLPNDNVGVKDGIKRQRCAEVIIKDHFNIEQFLAGIVCRSEAERETLINILDSNLINKYGNKIRVNKAFYKCKWHYIESVDLHRDSIRIQYANPDIMSFKYLYKFEYNGNINDIHKDKPIKGFTWKHPPLEYDFSIFIDNHIAYKGYYFDYDLPF